MKFCPLCDTQYDDDVALCPDDGATLIAEQVDPMLGQLLKGSYKIEQQIGAGGMGTVYKAIQNPLGRPVAVKLLNPVLNTPDVIKRFFREAQLLSQVAHPNIVSVIDFGNTEAGLIFMIMEYLDGLPLDEFVPRDEGLPLDVAHAMMEQICAGVSAAHHQELVHRDLKPSNIFVTRMSDGSQLAKTLDFGLVKLVEEDAPKLTQTGVIMGTPGYISPEQIDDASSADARSDIYALGGILYFLISGKEAFSGKSARAVLTRQLMKGPELSNFDELGLPAALREVIVKAMDQHPDERYQSVTELIEAVRQGTGHNATVLPHADAPRRATMSAIDPRSIEDTKLDPLPMRPSIPPRPVRAAEPEIPLWRRLEPRWLAAGAGGLLLLILLVWAIWSPDEQKPAETAPVAQPQATTPAPDAADRAARKALTKERVAALASKQAYATAYGKTDLAVPSTLGQGDRAIERGDRLAAEGKLRAAKASYWLAGQQYRKTVKTASKLHEQAKLASRGARQLAQVARDACKAVLSAPDLETPDQLVRAGTLVERGTTQARQGKLLAARKSYQQAYALFIEGKTVSEKRLAALKRAADRVHQPATVTAARCRKLLAGSDLTVPPELQRGSHALEQGEAQQDRRAYKSARSAYVEAGKLFSAALASVTLELASLKQESERAGANATSCLKACAALFDAGQLKPPPELKAGKQALVEAGKLEARRRFKAARSAFVRAQMKLRVAKATGLAAAQKLVARARQPALASRNQSREQYAKTDVLPPPEMARGFELFEQAERLTAAGKFFDAQARFKQAFDLWETVRNQAGGRIAAAVKAATGARARAVAAGKAASQRMGSQVPSSPLSWIDSGDLLLRQQKPLAARKAFEKGAQVYRAELAAFERRLALARDAAGAAQQAAENALALVSRRLPGLDLATIKQGQTEVARGKKLLGQEKFSQARQRFEAARRIYLRPLAAAYYQRGNTRLDKQNYPQAIADYSKAIGYDPDHHAAYYNRAFARYKIDAFKAALADYDAAIKLSPKDAGYRFARGLTLRKLRRLEPALRDFTLACEISPKLWNAWHKRGLTLAELGRTSAALTSLRKAHLLAPASHKSPIMTQIQRLER